MYVLKIGGNELDAPGFLEALATAVAQRGEPVVVVHGGGKTIAGLQRRFGLVPVKLNGLRVTDAETLSVAEMALSGNANKRLVRALLAAGVDAVGLSGVDGGLLRCQKKIVAGGDLGFVGEISSVRASLLHGLLQQGTSVVLSPISLGPEGDAYNVNADEAAAAVAETLKASDLDFVSNVPGVLMQEQLLASLTPAQTETLIREGVIAGGMIPKVQAALAAVARGVVQARIVDLAGLTTDGGTRFSAAVLS